MLPAALALDRLAVPVIGAPMFIVSQPELVIAQCKAGVIGAFPSLNPRPEPVLGEWHERIERELAEHAAAHPERPPAPFAVNLIVHKSNVRLMHDLEECVKHRVKIVITSLGARPEVNEAIHSYGGVVLHDVINVAFARKAVEKGADGLIAVAAGAGGHAGTWSPFALVQEIRAWFEGPLALSGAIANGRSVLAARDGRRPRLRRLGLHRHARSARERRVQSGDRLVGRARHRLHQPLHRRARQLSARLDRARRPGSREPAPQRSLEDELRLGKDEGVA
jgi:NAD(P)H-dependent flavin oxidoreductase YrpB (nitropropane dioxygenase family)